MLKSDVVPTISEFKQDLVDNKAELKLTPAIGIGLL